MKIIKNTYLKVVLAVFLSAVFAVTAFAQVRYRASAVITEDGAVVVKGATVSQITGTSFFVKTNWGETYLRWIVRTSENTRIVRRFGGISNINEIKEGDVLDIEGEIMTGSDTININAKKITDHSLENEASSFSGVVASVDSANRTFVMTMNDKTNLNVKIGTTSAMSRGILTIQIEELKVGEKILRADGSYHPPTATLTVGRVDVYQDKKIFIPKNFEGILRSLSASSLPTVAVISTGGRDYTVYFNEKTAVLNEKKKPANLARFIIGDKVRFYGAIRETDLTSIDADTFRNLDL